MFRNLVAYFRHHREERNGTIAILAILTVLVLASQAYYIWYKPPVKDPSEFMALMDSLKQLASAEEGFENGTEEITSDIFLFNPNTLSDSGYAALGFSEKEIKTLRNYQKAGAEFHVKTDFRKLFFVDENRYSDLEPFIDLPENYPDKVANPKTNFYKTEYSPDDHSRKRDTIKWSDTTLVENYEYKPYTCDLNRADTTELKKLPYIGSFYAREIIRYRDELGGYHSLAQLLELYKMTPETIDKFAEKVTIDKTKIRKINVNIATAQELSAHPYVDFALANKIIARRETEKSFRNLEQLCATGLVNAELCVKLAPYLIF
ncbi:helix-hairpin-helix domain-containing protein [Cryomorpha ignava]|uniref:Helix-hairpin-helix domain-containing protein n=1 Tax=Cryomorpha ignava TaxID=101383 RepID=A0A7K3WPN3_9FLAO|nr:helix-hairpin-helix domain-containing protein [Cryomorpha ignava]NEN22852.1 helix-hairpin-helix domain-containing protein [Cryomorpha ignava]